MDKNFVKEFENPSSVYRGKPFWAWNGKLEENELRRQVRIFNKMGLGGGFMHSRVGLATEYLGKDWFKCVEACADEVKRLGMEVWMYDEDRWPSGAAGGIVTKDTKYRARSIIAESFNNPKQLKWTKDTISAVTAKINGMTLSDVIVLKKGIIPKSLPKGTSIIAFRVVVSECSPWYNGYTYLNTLSRDAVKQFIKVTHDAYAKNVGKYFGKIIPGIFTDEPNYGVEDKGMPWTDELPEVFKRRYGYDITRNLAEVFFNIKGKEMCKARWNFHDCTTHLFTTAFAKQIGKWCDRNKVLHTGHVLSEETLSSQTRVVGNCMRFYEYMQAPGIDLLTEHQRIYTATKQLSSAARQFGRKWRLSELYGCTGWDFSFESHKAVGDWQAVLGINLRCQHLSWYTMLGEAKRDYPASIFYQSPWWEYYRTVEDYFARVHVAMTQGEEIRDLLVIHPIESMWTIFRNEGYDRKGTVKQPEFFKDSEIEKMDQMMDDLNNCLLSSQIDFDYGDEEILSRHTKITKENGRTVVKVGKATYKAVLVPPLRTIRSSTLKILKKFKELGGEVVFVGKIAEYVNAEKSDELINLAKNCVRIAKLGEDVVLAVSPSCRRIKVSDSKRKNLPNVLYMLREDKDAFYFFVVNTGFVPKKWNKDILSRDRKVEYREVRISGFNECKGMPVELDIFNGKMFGADAICKSGGWTIKTNLPKVGSRLFVIPKRSNLNVPARQRELKEVKAKTIQGNKWEVILSENNCLVLDRPAYKIGNGKWQKPEEILRVDSKIRNYLGVPQRGGAMVQPWAREIPSKPKRTNVTLLYEFNIESIPSGEMFLAIEELKRFKILINGHGASTDADAGWWVDMSLRRLPVDPSVLKIGRNVILLECDFDETFSGLEVMYIIGNFGAKASGNALTMTASVNELKIGDWCKQGLYYYGGSVTYVRKINPRVRQGQRLFVRIPEYRGVAVRVLVDGKQAGIIGWEPNEIDITNTVRGKKSVTLGIEILGHRRNSHGPLHMNEKWPFWTGPGQFRTSGKNWIEGYSIVPVGMMKSPQIVVKR